MPCSVTTFLMFTGSAEAAMNLYVSTFGGTVHHVERWAAGATWKSSPRA